MGRWNVSEAEVAAADAVPWEGRLRNLMRPFDYRTLVRAGLASAVLYLLASVGGFTIVATATRTPGTDRVVLVALSIWAVVLGATLVLACVFLSPVNVRRFGSLFGVVNTMTASVVVDVFVLASGPHLMVTAAGYVENLLFAFYMLRRRWAVVSMVLSAIGYGWVLWRQDGVAAPVTQWVVVMTIVVTAAVVVGGMAGTAQRLTESEHQARLELADVNRTLEDRVQAQVAQLESLGRLRRFLSSQVAEAITSVGSEGLLEPHRRQIAVFFCDLRGFTAFTNRAEPEDVLRVLDEYYNAVGALLQRYNATIGGYSGDGIMAYFGDPVTRDDPALDAVRMTTELRSPLDALVLDWEHRGYGLSYGIGLAYGYATLGVIGFDGRYDYTPLGSVVNLAARLCASASATQILIDHAMHVATSAQVTSAHIADLDLKGFGSTTRAYALEAPAA